LCGMGTTSLGAMQFGKSLSWIREGLTTTPRPLALHSTIIVRRFDWKNTQGYFLPLPCMMNKDMSFTLCVVMASHNRRRQTLESLVHLEAAIRYASSGKIEIILIEDGSTDGTE